MALEAQSSDIFTGEGGSIPFVSSNGALNGTAVVWAIKRPDNPPTQPLRLEAYDAANVANHLADLRAGSWFNPEGNPDITPTIANGRAYVPTGISLAVFGLH